MYKAYASGKILSAKAKEANLDKAAAEEIHPGEPCFTQVDLEEMNAVYVSTGANLNDDVFLPEELFYGLASVSNKPNNLEHNPEDILGHIVEAKIVTLDNSSASLYMSGMSLQSVIYSGKEDEAKKAASSDGYMTDKMKMCNLGWKFDQAEKSGFIEGSFRMKKKPSHYAVYAKPKESSAMAAPVQYEYVDHQGLDKYHSGFTDAASIDNHSHMWSFMQDSYGFVSNAWTSHEAGHRHNITPASLKDGKTCPGGQDFHTHSLLELDEMVRNKIVIAGEDYIDSTEVQIPEDFDILTKSVLYKGVYPKEVAAIMEEAKSGDRSVSMETYFNNFDYLVGDKVISRNDETKFLDASLRAFGGTGKFKEHTVKRVLRNLHFAGQGIVKNPANPRSEILSSEAESLAAVGSTDNSIQQEEILQKYLQPSMEVGVYIREKNTSATKAQVVEIQKANEKDSIMEIEALEVTKEALSKEIAELKATVASLIAELDGAKKSISDKSAEIDSLTKAKNDALASVETLNKNISIMIAEKRSGDFAKFDISAEDMKEVLSDITGMTDDTYAKYLGKANRLFKVKEQPKAISTEISVAAEAEKALASAVESKTSAIVGAGTPKTKVDLTNIFNIK